MRFYGVEVRHKDTCQCGCEDKAFEWTKERIWCREWHTRSVRRWKWFAKLDLVMYRRRVKRWHELYNIDYEFRIARKG